MLLKPKGTVSPEDFENKLLIEKWIKRNSSSKVTIGQNIVKPNDSIKTSNTPAAKNLSPSKAALNISTTKVIKKVITTPELSNIKSNVSLCNKKRPHEFLSDKGELSIAKVLRHSLPTDGSNLQKINKGTMPQTVNRKSEPAAKPKTVITKISHPTDPVKHTTVKPTGMKASTPIALTVKHSPTKPEPPSKADIKKVENNCSTQSSMKNLLSNDDTDVYTSLLENYRYLITPKSWSVTEFTNETKNRCIVFFNIHVIKENDTLISVMKKSLIIDKGAIMNYSVHGLPVDIQGTILPKILDNTKKLLSILHIFDKMQVCEGLGNDLNILQTDFVFKDSCRYWRHKHCKIVLIKATRCSVCSDTRTIVLRKKAISGDKPFDSSEFVGVKTEVNNI
ncbi:hypothetical protein TSAR_001654 [Trichomalopsis sarcophagae]|uniref:Uncharacterized protein n=1 Tax=Trichomalopsis sarcophagae TaxID=543379 RepID=A0A232FKT6_9HYME|nr:hypothetical protein TSAR_001654 [Trichomalopsis sarcophagae]